ncbi:MAG: ABC transporter permease [Chloroflexi bacterium]|nr:ABC transporter permease [Chloroflexota bacterium]
MSRYLLQRLALLLPTALGMSLFVFLMLRLIPGDTVDAMLGDDSLLSEEARADLRALLGLDQPLPIQYARWLGRVLVGDLGRSLRTQQDVSGVIAQHLPVTLELAALSITLAVVVAVPLGVLSAVRSGSLVDLAARLVGMLGLSFPNFWLATLLILVASVYFRWLPPLIWVSPFDDLGRNLEQIVLPVLALGTSQIAVIMRQTRSAVLETMGQEYVRTAHAKGLAQGTVVRHHILQNAWIPIVTIVGVQAGHLLGGAVIVEQIFGLPGIGWMLINGIFQRDYTIVQASVVLLAVFFVFINLTVDLLYGKLDPRVRDA